jgi:hypothetical protein
VLTTRPEPTPESDGPPAFPAQAVRGTAPDHGPLHDQPQQ